MSRKAWRTVLTVVALIFLALLRLGPPVLCVTGQIDACTAVISIPLYGTKSRTRAYLDRGLAYARKGDVDSALADYGQAIILDPYRALAYRNRGNAYLRQGHPEWAIADFDRAISLDPKDARAYRDLGFAYAVKGELQRAIAGCSEAIRLDPNNSTAYFCRGRVNLYSGALPEALADLDQASELDPKFAYTALWLDIANKRSRLSSRLAQAVKQIDMTRWPAPLIRLYLGQSSPSAALAAADDPDAVTKNDQICEANFYMGELALQQGKKDGAKRLFSLAVADCPKTFFEYEGATAELKALARR